MLCTGVPNCCKEWLNGLHSFPSKKQLAEKWILAIKAFELINVLNENKLSRSYRKVCKKHFRESDFIPNVDGKSQLAPNSVPSMFLPDEILVNKQTTKVYLNLVKRSFSFRILQKM